MSITCCLVGGSRGNRLVVVVMVSALSLSPIIITNEREREDTHEMMLLVVIKQCPLSLHVAFSCNFCSQSSHHLLLNKSTKLQHLGNDDDGE